jgi:hypothetical protein
MREQFQIRIEVTGLAFQFKVSGLDILRRDFAEGNQSSALAFFIPLRFIKNTRSPMIIRNGREVVLFFP